MALKVLHTADLHLGMAYRYRGYPEEVRQRLVETRFAVLDRLVELANQERCHLLVVAGDLFHRTNVSREIILRTLSGLARFQGSCVALLPGNHDYYEDYGTLWKELRENLFDGLVLLTETCPYPLDDFGLDAVLYPAPCNRKQSPKHRLEWIYRCAPRPGGRWHLGVAHGSLKGFSPDFSNQYYPMEEADLIRARLHYWFLGHNHVPYPPVDSFREGVFAYSGTPEPDGFSCAAAGGVWLTTLDDSGKGESTRLFTGFYRFQEIHREVWHEGDLEILEGFLGSLPEETLVKLMLTGRVPLEAYRALPDLYRKLAEHLTYLEVDDSGLSPAVTAETIAAEFPQGSFPYLLLNRLLTRGEEEGLQLAYQFIQEVRK